MVPLIPSRNDVALPPLSQLINIPSIEEAAPIGERVVSAVPDRTAPANGHMFYDKLMSRWT
eukprot:9301929-Lingulodinium_polyedra.AAC.1